MNNEIIELLLYKLEQNYKCEKENYFILYKPDIKDLLDYINTLQQENIKLISENEAIKSIKYTVDEVIYKTRNEKAIELLNKRKEDVEDLSWVEMRRESYYEECDELINILEGDDENEK